MPELSIEHFKVNQSCFRVMEILLELFRVPFENSVDLKTYIVTLLMGCEYKTINITMFICFEKIYKLLRRLSFDE